MKEKLEEFLQIDDPVAVLLLLPTVSLAEILQFPQCFAISR